MATTPTTPRYSDQLREQTRRNAAFFLTLLCLLYALFFLPDSVVNYAQGRLTTLAGVLTALGSALSSGILGLVLGLLITGHDPLATGNSRAARFFQDQYPSRAITLHYNCPQPQADQLWFDLFNQWETNNPSKYVSYVLTRERGNACRRVFAVRMSLLAFVLISGVSWLAAWLFGLDTFRAETAFTRGLLLVLVLTVAAILFVLNRLRPLTGCWWYWKEINDINKAWLQNGVFASAATYADALRLINDPVWRNAHGYI